MNQATLRAQRNKMLFLSVIINIAFGAKLSWSLFGSTLIAEYGWTALQASLPYTMNSVLMFLLFFATIGPSLCKRVFRFQELEPENMAGFSEETGRAPGWKRALTLITLLVCVLLFVFSSYALGAVAVTGGMLLMLTGCVDPKRAIHEVRWETAFLLIFSIGFAKAVEVSGAGLVIANAIIRVCGPVMHHPFGVTVVALVCASLLSNLMSNSGTAIILVPIFMAVADQIGAPVIPVVLAAGVGVNLATATPVCTANITLTTEAGYRFSDYVKIGGLLNILGIITAAAALYLRYYL